MRGRIHCLDTRLVTIELLRLSLSVADENEIRMKLATLDNSVVLLKLKVCYVLNYFAIFDGEVKLTVYSRFNLYNLFLHDALNKN